MDDHSSNRLSSMIVLAFGLDPHSEAMRGDEDAQKSELERIINYLLDHDMERLLQVLYRIDVHEEKVKEVMTTYAVEELAAELAQLVIERLRQKVYYRNKYGRQTIY